MLLVSVLVFSNMWLSKKNLEYGLFGACTPELSSWCSVWCSSTPKATHQRFQWIKSAKFRSWIHFLNFMSTNFAADLTSSGLGAVASFWCIAGLATFSLTCVVFLSMSQTCRCLEKLLYVVSLVNLLVPHYNCLSQKRQIRVLLPVRHVCA